MKGLCFMSGPFDLVDQLIASQQTLWMNPNKKIHLTLFQATLQVLKQRKPDNSISILLELFIESEALFSSGLIKKQLFNFADLYLYNLAYLPKLGDLPSQTIKKPVNKYYLETWRENSSVATQINARYLIMKAHKKVSYKNVVSSPTPQKAGERSRLKNNLNGELPKRPRSAQGGRRSSYQCFFHHKRRSPNKRGSGHNLRDKAHQGLRNSR